MITQLNASALRLFRQLAEHANRYRVAVSSSGNVLDFGVNVAGGLQAGLHLTEICMGDLVTATIVPVDFSTSAAPPATQLIHVTTDQPAVACMASQYGGWPVSTDDFFAIGSGPFRVARGKEPVLEKYGWKDTPNQVVGVLESANLPDDSVIEMIAQQCQVKTQDVFLCVAPTRSLAGTIQIVGRSVEATMHKLFELGVDITRVVSASGTAPLPPLASDDLTAIGHTNDAILYGGQVTLWVDMSDQEIAELGPQTPSNFSDEFGKPFIELFEACGNDFYKLDPMLFSAAIVRFVSTQTGAQFQFGETKHSLLHQQWTVQSG